MDSFGSIDKDPPVIFVFSFFFTPVMYTTWGIKSNNDSSIGGMSPFVYLSQKVYEIGAI